jgi:transcriptional regulator GlxA family with amidase domain
MLESAIHVAFVLAPGMLISGTTLPLEMWQAADQRHVGLRRGHSRFCSYLLGLDADRDDYGGIATLRASHRLDQVDHVDVVYLPALWRDPRAALRALRPCIPWFLNQAERGALFGAAGTGVSLLAETGLLDDRPATTHWYYFEQFAQRYPNVRLKRDYFITRAGSFYCVAGINALSDLSVHFIQRFYGRDVADHVERTFSHEIRRAYEKRSFYAGLNLKHPDELISEIQQWMQAHLSESIRIGDIAERFGISERSLSRRFNAATDMAPQVYLQTLRIDVAKELLQATNLSIGEIAFQIGVPDQRHFARIFRNHLGTSPRDYRATVRAKLFSASTTTAS